MTRALARELGPDGITVNAIAPGLILSDTVQANPDITAFQVTADHAGPLAQARGVSRGRGRHRGVPRLRRQRVHDRPDARRGRRLGVLDALAMATTSRSSTWLRPGRWRAPSAWRWPRAIDARLPRDRLLRDHRPRRARGLVDDLRSRAARVLRAAARRQARGAAPDGGHESRLSPGGRRGPRRRRTTRGAARPQGVLPRRARGVPGDPYYTARWPPRTSCRTSGRPRRRASRSAATTYYRAMSAAHRRPHAAGRAGARRARALLRRQGRPLDRHHARSTTIRRRPCRRAAGQLRASAHTDYGGVHDPERRGRARRPSGLHARRPTGWTSPTVARHLRGEHRRPADALDQRPLALEPAPRREPAARRRRRAAARLSIAFFNHPNYDALIECLPSQGAPRHTPVLSGDYRDVKYAKTGFTAARTG